MDKNSWKIIELVQLFAKYVEEQNDCDIDNFCRHRLKASSHWKKEDDHPWPMEAALGRTTGRLSRFADIYSKLALRPLGFNNIDDFVYLMGVYRMKNPRKGELIFEHLSEFSTGMATISRLVDRGWIREKKDPDDGRSIRLHITKAGEKKCMEALPRMKRASRMVFGPLSEEERELFLWLGGKIDRRHTTVHEQNKCQTLEEWEQVWRSELKE
jgi:DNA-binding MarR family transcriptional regulator